MKSKFFETICIEEGGIKHLEYHQKRYEYVQREHGQTTFADLAEVVEGKKVPKRGLYRCRLEYTLENEFESAFFAYQKRPVTLLKAIVHNSIEYSFKSVERSALDRLYVQRGEADDVLIVKGGYLTDTTIANIALCQQGRWYTPDTPLLRGTTRERLLDEGKIFERSIRVEDLKNYDALALMNAMIGFDRLDSYEILL